MGTLTLGLISKCFQTLDFVILDSSEEWYNNCDMSCI